MKSLSIPALLPLLLLLPLFHGFRPIQLNTHRGAGKILTNENILDVVKQGLTNQEAKQILMKLFRTKQQDSYMKKAGKGFDLKLKMKDLVQIFSKSYARTEKNTDIRGGKFTSAVIRIN